MKIRNVFIGWYPKTKVLIMVIRGYSDFASGGKLLKDPGLKALDLFKLEDQFIMHIDFTLISFIDSENGLK